LGLNTENIGAAIEEVLSFPKSSIIGTNLEKEHNKLMKKKDNGLTISFMLKGLPWGRDEGSSLSAQMGKDPEDIQSGGIQVQQRVECSDLGRW